MVSIHRILCPIDFSDFSLDALRHGLVLARWYSAQLTLLHVYQLVQPLPVEGMPATVPPFVDVDPAKAAVEVRRSKEDSKRSGAAAIRLADPRHTRQERIRASVSWFGDGSVGVR